MKHHTAKNETPAKGVQGFIVFIGDVQDPEVYFRVYERQTKREKKTDTCPKFTDYKVSNYDFRFKVVDKMAAFRRGNHGWVLDLNGKAMGREYKDEENAYGKELMAHLLMERERGPQVVLHGKQWKDDRWFRLTHPDLEIKITDKDAALFRNPKNPDDCWLDYTTKSMEPAVSFSKGKCVWASKEAFKKGWLTKGQIQDLKEIGFEIPKGTKTRKE